MGLFSSKKIIKVASVTYNMAGEEKDRPIYRRNLVTRNILSGTKDSIATSLINGYMNGPAMNMRRFFRWATTPGNYDQVGVPTGEIVAGASLDPADLNPLIPHDPAYDIWTQKAEIGGADISYWADQWILLNRPDDIETEFEVDYDKATNKISIKFVDNTTTLFTPAGFDVKAKYIYAYYTLTSDETVEGVDVRNYDTEQVFIYKVGSGNAALDALVSTANYSEFFPFIPVRLNNNFLSSTYLSSAYEQAKKAYDRAIGGDFDEMVEQLKDNEDLDDIDNAYVVFGVSLNTRDQASRRYVYQFFDQLRQSQIGGPDAYDTFKAQVEAQKLVADTWIRWKSANSYAERRRISRTSPEPPRPRFAQLPTNSIRIRGSGSVDVQFDMRLDWTFIDEGSGTGRGKPGAKVNECWIEKRGDDMVALTVFSTQGWKFVNSDKNFPVIRIYWQKTKNSYTYLDVVNAAHHNYVYGGKKVGIEAKEALDDGDESGFIVPLHYDTLRSISLADATQMSTTCAYMVFNCYVVKKQRWYQRGIFKFLFGIILAILAVVFTGGAGIGLLGAHLAVGTSLGFTGLTAAIVGSIVNAMAAMILSTIIEKVAGALGPIGGLIGSLFMFFVGNIASSFQNLGSINWSSFLRVDNLLGLTSAIGDGLTKMIQMETAALAGEMADYAKKAQEETKKIQQAFFDEFGYGAGIIDPFMLVDTKGGPIAESSDTFLTRTLMTGSDIADMSQQMLYNFPEYSLTLPNAFT